MTESSTHATGVRQAGTKPTAPAWAQEWREAEAAERAEAVRAPRPPTHWIGAGFALGVAASLAGLLPALFPFSPGFSTHDTAAQVVAAVVAATVALALVPLASSVATRAAAARDRGFAGLVLFGVVLLSTGAAAIHLAVAKSHFEEYILFGVFFLLSGAVQLAWPLLVLFRPVRPLLALGAIGNLLIAALWALDRIWGLPIGPEHGKPDPVGFADAAASSFEFLLALGCLALLAPALHARAQAQQMGGPAVILTLAVLVPTVLALLSAVGVGSSFLTPSD